MAYNPFLADRIEQRLSHKGLSEVKKMMGGLVFMVQGKMAIGLDMDKRTGNDRLMVRVGKNNYPDLLHVKGSREMDMTGKIMNGYLFVGPEGFDKDEDLDFWIHHAIQFNKELIQKDKK